MNGRLWAPWRLKYISSLSKKETGCLFCRIGRSKNDKKNLVFLRSKHSFAVLNLYPYNNGHALIVPRKHVNDIDKLSPEDMADLFDLLLKVKKRLKKVLKCEGFNIGINLGRVAGAGIPGHVHIHIVPRWNGDVNFMPSVSGTKVISQSLEDCYKLLASA